ncbi:MAG: hypothetical protein PHF25_02510 [Candidatus Margulisbacteria bacterium]|nr:hypothetical protein [Candidatus Margulisiibacteriota bacterium]
MHDKSWEKIFKDSKMDKHNFDACPFTINARDIKNICQDFKETGEKEVRVLCKQDTRESRPQVFKDRGLFLLPRKNGEYLIVKGEGYVNIPEIKTEEIIYVSKLDFKLDTTSVGDSEMQHLDYAYAVSLIRTFMNDNSLILTIRGRKYTPPFSFKIGQHKISTESVQTEVDAGYEGKDKLVLIEAKNGNSTNTIIRQLFYPYRQWKSYTDKDVFTMFFEKHSDSYCIWQFTFDDEDDYNSIRLVKSGKYKILERE